MKRIEIERLTIRFRGVEVQRARESVAGLRGELIRSLSGTAGTPVPAPDVAGSATESNAPTGERSVSALRRRTADAIVREVRTAQKART